MSTPDPRGAPGRAEITLVADDGLERTQDVGGRHTAPIGADQTVGDGERPYDGMAPLEPGTRVGRYVVDAQLGAGGMGVVYAALDPQLERKVAVKLVHAAAGPTMSGGSGRTSTGASRLLREAQAMAKLHHRNVIVVHDVGTVGDQVFIAMEYLDGGTLREWVERERPSWEAVLERFIAAGEGLAAAHAAGIVHRDFKPENVLLGTDGRICVMDFGLARGVASGPADEVETVRSTDTGSPGLRLTQTGAIMGTPAYMAPEQHEGRAADERSDQFAFCVALYEALYGRRPFEGDTLTTLVVNVVEGNMREPEPGHGVPRYLLSVLARGLDVDPERRFASMPALLAALRHDPALRRRRRRWIGVVAALALVGGGAGIVAAVATDEDPAVCTGAEAQIRDVWNDDRRASIGDALANAGGAEAAAAWTDAAGTLDAYADAWVAMHTAACEATRVRGEQSEELLDRRMVCLSKRRAGLANLASMLAEPDVQIVRRLPQLVASLEPVSDCEDVEALLAETTMPAANRERILAAYAAIARARNLRTAIKFRDAEKVVLELAAEVESLGFDPLTSSYKYLRASIHADLGEHEQAEKTLYDAAIFAAKVGDDETAAIAWIALARLVGVGLGRSNEVDPIVKAAEAAVARLDDAPYLRGSLLSTKGSIAVLNEDNVAAEAALREAYALLSEHKGPEHDNTLETREMLAVALQAQEKLDEAEGHMKAILEIRERQVGKDHPALASLLGNLGLISSARGDYAEAERLYVRCHELLVRGYGPKHQAVVTSLLNLGNARRRQGKYDDAQADLHEALALSEELFDGGPRVAWVHLARNRLFASKGDWETARAEAEAAEKILVDAYDAEYPRVADAQLGQGKALVELGRAADAVPLLERAAEIRAKSPEMLPRDRAELAFELGRALFDSGRDRARARQLVIDARDLLADGDDADAKAEVAAWLRAHG